MKFLKHGNKFFLRLNSSFLMCTLSVCVSSFAHFLCLNCDKAAPLLPTRSCSPHKNIHIFPREGWKQLPQILLSSQFLSFLCFLSSSPKRFLMTEFSLYESTNEVAFFLSCDMRLWIPHNYFDFGIVKE